MLRTILLTTLTTVIVSFAVFSIPIRSYALENQKPCDMRDGCADGGWNGIPGPGPGDLGGNTMPPGGDDRKNPRPDKAEEKEVDKPRPPVKPPITGRSKSMSGTVHSIGR